uniref:Immunoglobulin domain-containing protein n=1 Tax=Sinocyclocheilus rhinocerous TaxID=307959 RepID=A0A673K730_9TELE
YHLKITSRTLNGTRASDVGTDTVSVFAMKGDSVTLHTNITINQRERFKWYFIDDLIAQINGDQRYICTDVKCNKEDERFRDRLKLKLDHQTGSLTITNTRTTDSGLYKLQIKSSRNHYSVTSFLSVDADNISVSVVEGDSVTLLTDVKISQQERMKWYMNDIRIAQIIDSQRKICTDVQCDERFRGRLQLDHQTGALTIMNIRTTDSGLYQLLISSSSSIEEKFNVSVHGVSADERNQMKRTSVKEGGSVTLDPGVIKNPNDVMMWYFNGTLMNEIDGDPIKICEDVQCTERFRDRLKLDHQTGSLTITNTRTTDSGLYQLEISSHQCHGRCTVTRRTSSHRTDSHFIGFLSDQCVTPVISIIFKLCCSFLSLYLL